MEKTKIKEYIKNRCDCVICDLDGTLAIDQERGWYDYFELTNEFILSKLLNVDCSINMNIIEHSHKVYSMIDILNRSIILMDIKECARLYNIPNEFIKHHVEERMNPIFEDLCMAGTLDELAVKISKININDLKKEIDNNALLG